MVGALSDSEKNRLLGKVYFYESRLLLSTEVDFFAATLAFNENLLSAAKIYCYLV